MKVYSESKFLKHQDLDGKDWVVTIDRVEREVMKDKDGKEEKKFVLYFKEVDKGMILNATNMGTITNLFHSDESEEWAGKKITIYEKDDVEMGGKLVSGLRVRPKLPMPVTT